jgi:hypothetical protein
MNVPMYRAVTWVDWGSPNIRKPTMMQRALRVMKGPRRRNLSAVKEVTMTGIAA